MNKQNIHLWIIIFALLIIATLLGVKSCNAPQKQEVDALLKENASYKQQVEQLQAEKAHYADSAATAHLAYVNDSTLLAQAVQQREALKTQVAVLDVKIKTTLPDRKSSADSIVKHFAELTVNECHEDSLGECLADSARVPVGRIISANNKIEIGQILYKENSALKTEMEQSDILQKQSFHAIVDLKADIKWKDATLGTMDSINTLQYKQINNLTRVVKDDKKISRRRIAGFTIGGFTVGVGVTALVLLLKH